MDVYIKKSMHLWHIERDGRIVLRPLYCVKVIATDLAESPMDIPDEEVESAVKKYVEKVITESYALAEPRGLDPYSLKGKYQKKYGKRKDVEIDFSLEIKVTVSDA